MIGTYFRRLLSYGLPTDLKDNEQKAAADIAGSIEIRDLINRWSLEKTNTIEKRNKVMKRLILSDVFTNFGKRSRFKMPKISFFYSHFFFYFHFKQ